MSEPTIPAPLQRVGCPTCDAAPAAECVTASGRIVRGGHAARWDHYFRELRESPSRWRLHKDDERFGLAEGDVLVGRPYWLDPDKVTVEYRESDGFDPQCNQYRVDIEWIGWSR